MKRRGPISSAALAVAGLAAPIRALPPALVPPATLTPAESEAWRQTVSALPAGWLSREQGPLLERYVKHLLRAQCLEQLIAATDPTIDLDVFSKLSRLAGEESGRILALARSMRITVQSRIQPATAGNRAAGPRVSRGIEALFERDHQ
jgi:hypothetical protein